MATTNTPFPISAAELKLLQTLVYRECGMHFDARRTHFLQERLQRRLRVSRSGSFYSYYNFLTSAEGRTELAQLLEELTVNETSFFRNKPQLELFQKVILEEVLRQKQAQRDWHFRIWSAGCSTGQEPYTLAMLVSDALSYFHLRNSLPLTATVPRPLIPEPWKVEIIASDISYTVLRQAQEGCYTHEQMEHVDHMYRLRYFDRTADRYTIKPALRQLVQFDFHNLKTEFLPPRNDFIFCRNVMIYFDEAEQRRLIQKLHRCLNPGGYLFLGHAESLFGLSDDFRLIQRDNSSAYQKKEAQC